MTLKSIVKTIVAVVFFIPAFSQSVNVDHHTGTAITSIPLWDVKDGNLHYPVSLVNIGDGVPADAGTGEVGTGWRISEASISRVLKGLPDDYSGTVSSVTRHGWLTQSTASLINNFIPEADDDLTNCTDENNDYIFLNDLGGFSSSGTIKDTEPDIFFVEMPGFTASFVFDQNGQIKFIDKTDCLITPSFNANNQLIGFTIIDQSGVKYIFGRPFSMSIQAKTPNPSGISHFQNDYVLYKDKITFNASWYLTSIGNLEGDNISFVYRPPIIPTGFSYPPLKMISTDSIHTYLYNTSTNGYQKQLQYVIEQTWGVPQQLLVINTNNQYVQFDYVTQVLGQGNYDLVQVLLNSISIYNPVNVPKVELIRQFSFVYSTVKPLDDPSQRTHIFLDRLYERTNEKTLPPYTFKYYGVDLEQFSILVGNRKTKAKDEFNFHADIPCCTKPLKTFVYPALPKPDKIRSTPAQHYGQDCFEFHSSTPVLNLARLLTGALKQVNLQGGGSMRIKYLPKTYLDRYSQLETYGGGLRVSSVEFHDGIDFSKDIIKVYDYKKDDGKSSGVLISRPERVTNWSYYYDNASEAKFLYNELMSQGISSQDIWKRILVYTDLPFNRQVHSVIGYSKVTEQVIGQGKTSYEFDVPAGYGVTSETDWNATKTRIARQKPTTTNPITTYDLGPVNGYYAYPFAPQPNYHFKRGLLKRITHFDNNNYPVEETTHEYINSSNPTKLYGLKLAKSLAQVSYTDYAKFTNEPFTAIRNVQMFVYSKYEINTQVVALLKQTNHKIFDRNSSTANVLTSTVYEYGSTRHRLPTRIVTTNSDGVEYIQKNNYSSDFTITASWSQQDEMCRAITKLTEKNLIVPIETVVERKQNVTTLTTGATLSIFQYDETNDRILPLKTLEFTPGSPVSGFTSATINNSSTSSFVYNQSDYKKFVSYSNHTSKHIPQSILSYDRSKSGIHYIEQPGVPKVLIRNALASEVRYTDFELPTSFEFAFNNNNVVASGRLGSRGYSLPAGTVNKISATITKGFDNTNVFSCWVNSGVNGTLTIRVLDGVHAEVAATITITNTGGQWKYYSTNINVATMNPNFTIELESSVALTIDDVAFYPGNTQLRTYLYAKNFLKMAETDFNGITTTFEYDDFERPIIVRDHDRNILKTYVFENQGKSLYVLPEVSVTKLTALSSDIYNRGWPGYNVNTGVVCKWKILSFSEYTSNPIAINDFSNAIIISNNNTITYNFPDYGKYVINLQVTYQNITRKLLQPYIFEMFSTRLNVSLCANRPSPLDLCKPIPLSSGCNPTQNNSLVLFPSVTGGSGSYNYRWQDEMGNDLGSTAILIVPSYLNNRTYNCFITDTISKAVGSATFTMHIFKSNPSCTVNPQ